MGILLRSTSTATCLALLMACAAGGGGCAGRNNPADAGERRVTLAELDQLNKGFADRFVVLVASACDEIEKDNPSPLQRHKAHELKLYCATSAFDIATNADPYTGLLDMVLSATLISHVWIDEDRAEEVFGPERAPVLIRALRRARVEAWEVAARALKPEQLELLDYLIWHWRQANPEVEHVEFVRFNEFAASRGKTQLADVRTGGGLLAPVGDATKAVDEARLFGERAFYLGKRAPLVLTWQAKELTNELVATPEIAKVLANVDNVSASADRLTKAIDRLPQDIAAERKALVAAMDEREKTLNATITNVRGAIADTDRLLANVNQFAAGSAQRLVVEVGATGDSLTGALQAFDVVADRFSERRPTTGPSTRPGEGGGGGGGATRPAATEPAWAVAVAQPHAPDDGAVAATPPTTAPSPAASAAPTTQTSFDIRHYADTATELAKAAREMRLLVDSTQGLVSSPAWSKRIEELNTAADDRVRLAAAQSQLLVDDIFRRVYLTIAFVFLMLVLLRLVWLTVRRRVRPAGAARRGARNAQHERVGP